MNKFLLCLELEMAGFVLGGLSAIGFGTAYIFLATVAFFGWFLGGVIRPSESLIHQLYISESCRLSSGWLYCFVFFFIHSSAGSELVLLLVFVLLLRDDGRGNPADSWNQKSK